MATTSGQAFTSRTIRNDRGCARAFRLKGNSSEHVGQVAGVKSGDEAEVPRFLGPETSGIRRYRGQGNQEIATSEVGRKKRQTLRFMLIETSLFAPDLLLSFCLSQRLGYESEAR